MPVVGNYHTNFKIKMFLLTGADLFISATPTSESAVVFGIYMDPFVFIDPEWEYADEYTLVLSPEMYVGPPLPDGDINGDFIVDLKDVIYGLQVLTDSTPLGLNIMFGDVNDNDRIGLEEVLYDLVEISE